MMPTEKQNFLNEFGVYTVAEQIEDHIKEKIIFGNLQQGEKLPSEIEMAEQLNVSRNTIRRALTNLIEQKLIETKKGRNGGHYVSAVTSETVRLNFGDAQRLSLNVNGMSIGELIEYRQIVETEAAYLAAQRRTKKDLNNLVCAIRFVQEENLSDLLFCKYNYLFNRYMSIATHNRLIITSFNVISRVIVPLFKHITISHSLRMTLNSELVKIYAAIDDQDAKKAMDLMERHLHHFENYFQYLHQDSAVIT